MGPFIVSLRQINLSQKACRTFPFTSHWLQLHPILVPKPTSHSWYWPQVSSASGNKEEMSPCPGARWTEGLEYEKQGQGESKGTSLEVEMTNRNQKSQKKTYSKTKQKKSLSQRKTQVCKASRLNTFQELSTKSKWQGSKRIANQLQSRKSKKLVPYHGTGTSLALDFVFGAICNIQLLKAAEQ